MNIGLISDTHIPEAMPELPVQIRQVFADTALILHAGDLHCLAVLDWLEEIAPVRAARGNGDSGSGGRPVVHAVEEFLLHGVKYAFPAKRGEVTRGVPTSYAAAPLSRRLTRPLQRTWPAALLLRECVTIPRRGPRR